MQIIVVVEKQFAINIELKPSGWNVMHTKK